MYKSVRDSTSLDISITRMMYEMSEGYLVVFLVPKGVGSFVAWSSRNLLHIALIFIV